MVWDRVLGRGGGFDLVGGLEDGVGFLEGGGAEGRGGGELGWEGMASRFKRC